MKYDNDIESWLPKDEFEETYKCADTFLDRLLIEQQDLAEKFSKLCAFVDTPKFEEVVKMNTNVICFCNSVIIWASI